MYKVVLFGLLFLALITFLYSLIGILFFSPISLFSSFALLLVFSFLFNAIFSKIFKVTTNAESSLITALILFFIMHPLSTVEEVWVFILAPFLAMGSKYLLKFNKKHFFNPAAFALVVIGFLQIPQVSWWIGNSDLFPFVLVVGLLVLRKVRKFRLFTTYFIFALISISIFAYLNDRNIFSILYEAITSYPILFLGTIMLVEPLTTPSRNKTQMVYGGLVGMLLGVQFHHFGSIHSSPELALLIGNVYSYVTGYRQRLELKFIEMKELGEGIYEIVFAKNKNFHFIPGQYMEWTLGGFRSDMRGNRRFFTISSSPTEDYIKIGLKISDNGSKFKKKLSNLIKDEKIYANSLSGDFIISERHKKYVFLAGGIGVTPFRSIIKNAVDKNEKLDAYLFYACSKEGEFVYKDLFESAEKLGLKVFYVCSHPSKKWIGIKGKVNSKMIKSEVKDYKDRNYYLSGPNVMVNSYKKQLKSLGIAQNKIKTDYFSGY